MEELENEIKYLENNIQEMQVKIDDLESKIYDLKYDIDCRDDQIFDKERDIEELERKLEQAGWTGVEPVVSDISLCDAIKIKEVMMSTLKELGIRFKEINNG